MFLGSWSNIASGTSTVRLGAAGVITFASDLPTTTVTYNVALGGSVRNGTANPISVDAARSTGTLSINFANRTGTLSVPLFAADGSSLGTVTGSVTLPAGTATFTGTITFGGQTIEFFRSLDEVTLIIRNDETGEETRIVVPLFIEVD